MDIIKFLANNYPQISDCMCRKVIMTGYLNAVQIDEPKLRGHICPTLKGVSGGLVHTIKSWKDDKVVRFSGIHVGGKANLRTNFAISTTHPAFVSSYIQIILEHEGTTFIDEHKKELQEWTMYWQTDLSLTEKLPAQDKNVWNQYFDTHPNV